MRRRVPQTLIRAVVGALFFTLTGVSHAETLFVANDGIDQDFCGHAAVRPPCRSITLGIRHAIAGDHIVVGPGVYSRDLGETGAPGCSCLVAVDKRVSIVSSDGAAATVIDGRSALVEQTVLVIANGAEFGKPGQGFTVMQTGASSGPAFGFVNAGIVVDAANVKVRGNQVLSVASRAPGSSAAPAGWSGIATVATNDAVLIEQNQVIGWRTGIDVRGCNKTVSGNHVTLNDGGIFASEATDPSSQCDRPIKGNVVVANGDGITVHAPAAVEGNATIGNYFEGITVWPMTSTEQEVMASVQDNNIFGNSPGGNCGLLNRGVFGAVATHNYWGAATGPGADPADDVCNPAETPVTTTPFATRAFNVNPLFKP